MTFRKNPLKLYFLGSGKIAVPILEALRKAPEIFLVGAGTQPDRPAGRKCLPTPTPVGSAAEKLGIEPDKFPDVNAPEAVAKLHALAPDMLLVVSYGQLLKTDILELPALGCVNVHASLLPHHRGASPIVQALLRRELETGVCFMRMERGLDTGPVYAAFHHELRGDEYAETLELELGKLAAGHAAETLLQIADGVLKPEAQNPGGATVCRKIRKAEGEIDWRRPAAEIEAMIRAYSPWPGAHCRVETCRGTLTLTLIRGKVRPDLTGTPGEVLHAGKDKITVVCGEGALDILELAPAGKGVMSAGAFMNGLRGTPPHFTSREQLPRGSSF